MFELCLIQVFSSFEFKIARAKTLLETFSELYANKGDIILEFFFGFQGYANKGDIILDFFSDFKVVVLDSILPACSIMW